MTARTNADLKEPKRESEEERDLISRRGSRRWLFLMIGI